MITYDAIQSIYRAEKRSPNSLEKIDGDFCLKVLKFLSNVEESHRGEISNIVEEILQMRKNKILRLAARTGESSPPENMIPAEKELYNEITGLLADYGRKILSDEEVKPAEVKGGSSGIITGSAPVEKSKLRILRQMPSIIGSDIVHYGPFKEDDIIELPKETAKILIEHGIAEELIE